MSEDAPIVTPPKRKVGLMLGLGIFFLPIIFAWFLLRKGHSTRSRVIGFGWMILLIVVSLLTNEPAPGGSGAPAASKTAAETAAPAKIGDLLATDGAAVQIEGVSTRDAVGSQYAREAASEGGVLVVVRYAVKNTGDKPLASYDRPRIKLMDAAGVVYDPDIAKSSAFAMEGNFDTKVWSDLNPGITTHGADVFEVAQDRYDPATWRIVVGDKSRLVAMK